MKRRTVQLLSALHTATYRVTGGKIGRHLRGTDILLLTTTGNRTGRPRTVPLLYLRDGPAFVVIASYGGRPHHPDWYTNLEHDPKAEVRVDGTLSVVTAEGLDGSERDAWWARAVVAWPDYAVYQRRTERVIPVLRLRPVRTDDGAPGSVPEDWPPESP